MGVMKSNVHGTNGEESSPKATSGMAPTPSSGGEPRRFPKYWRGYITGTNRGHVWLKIWQGKDKLRADVLLIDQQSGPATLRLEGPLMGEKPVLRLRLTAFGAPGVMSPLDGGVEVLLADDERADSRGQWWTDIGSNGALLMRPLKRGYPKWLAVRIRAALLRYGPQTLGFLYVLTLFCAGILALTDVLHLSAWPLVLLLVPGPFLLRRPIKAILIDFGVSKAGPFEFRPQPPPESMGLDSVPLAAGTVPQDSEQIRRYFATLDEFFVPVTKALVLMLSLLPGGLEIPHFVETAKKLGARESNIPAILQAITETGVAQLQGDRVVLTPLGRAWLARWKYVTAINVPNAPSGTKESE